jgi:hypothetical protein
VFDGFPGGVSKGPSYMEFNNFSIPSVSDDFIDDLFIVIGFPIIVIVLSITFWEQCLVIVDERAK